MTQKEITEGNKLIAEFIGWWEEPGQYGSWYKKDDTAIYVAYSIHNNYPHQDLPFHRSWDWLMPVVEKCYSSQDDGYMDTLCEKFDFFYIEPMYNAVIKYIKWYNENKS